MRGYKYACENVVILQRGWHIRENRYLEDSATLLGKEPKT